MATLLPLAESDHACFATVCHVDIHVPGSTSKVDDALKRPDIRGWFLGVCDQSQLFSMSLARPSVEYYFYCLSTEHMYCTSLLRGVVSVYSSVLGIFLCIQTLHMSLSLFLFKDPRQAKQDAVGFADSVARGGLCISRDCS